MKRITRALILLAVTCLACGQILSQNRDEYLAQMMKYLKDGRVNQAIILATVSRKSYPDDPFFQFIGENPDPDLLLTPSPSPRQAREASGELLDLADILTGMGNDYTSAGMSLYRKVLDNNPEQDQLVYRYARKLYQLPGPGPEKESGNLVDRLSRIPGDTDKEGEIAEFAALLRRIASEETLSASQMESSYPEFAEDYGIVRVLAKISMRNRSCQVALEHLEKLARHRLVQPEDLRLLSEAWSCLGEKEKAETVLLRSERLSRNFSALNTLNTGLRSAKKEEAIRGLELLVSREPGFLPAVRLLAGVYSQAGKKLEASAVCRDYLQANPDDVAIRETAARLLLDEGRYDQAAELLAGHPETETSRMVSAFQMIQGSNWSGAERLIIMVLPANPLDPLVLYKLIQSLGGQGRIREAREYLKKGLKINPSDSVLQAAEESIEFDYARHLSDQGRRAESIAAYRKLVKINPDESQYLLNLGYEEMMNGEYARAVSSFRKGLKLAPGEDWARSGLAYCLMQEWEFDQAVEEMKIVVSRSNDPDYLFQLGSMYNQIGNTREGWSYIRKAAKMGHAKASELVRQRYGKN